MFFALFILCIVAKKQPKASKSELYEESWQNIWITKGSCFKLLFSLEIFINYTH